jgi:cytochrome P450
MAGLLTLSSANIMPPVNDEILHGFRTIMPPCDEWTSVKIAGVFKQMIARASNRMMGGTTLSRNDRWIQTSLDFTTDAFMAAQRLKTFPIWLRPIVQWFIPEMKAVWKHQRTAQEVIKPLLRQRQRDVEEKAQSKPEDLLQMLEDGANGPEKSHKFLAYTTLAVSFAAIHTSASVPAHLVYDLCARPEYITLLREEVEAMLKEEDGKFTKAGLSRLVKMDSFMKESQRFNPLSFCENPP